MMIIMAFLVKVIQTNKEVQNYEKVNYIASSCYRTLQ